MAGNLILPLGQHRLDPSPDFDPVRSLLRSLWTDLFWTYERILPVEAAHEDDPAEVNRELVYLRGDADDALQHLARLIGLLLAGHAVDPTKRIPKGTSSPYFVEGESMAAQTILPRGQHPLDPPPAMDAVRYFLGVGKANLVRIEEGRVAYQRLRDINLGGAAREIGRLRGAAEDARRHLGRLIELLLAGGASLPDHQLLLRRLSLSGKPIRCAEIEQGRHR